MASTIQIWIAMPANLLITLAKSKIKRKWAFLNMVFLIRQQLMNYINLYNFLEDLEASPTDSNEVTAKRESNTLLKQHEGFQVKCSSSFLLF